MLWFLAMLRFIAMSWLCLLSLPVHAEDVLAYWSDGKAEMSAYRLTQPRYGELHPARAVLIVVKEDFSESNRVKADPGRHPPADVFPVIKLNYVKDFQTGIYDYNLMTSVFAAMSRRSGLRLGTPAKITFSSQEWCGSMYEEWLVDPSRVRRVRHTYFDGDDLPTPTLDLPKEAFFVDELLLAVRGLGGELLEKGQSREGMFLPSLERARLHHFAAEWTAGRLTRSPQWTRRSVPMGAFEVESWVLELSTKDRYEFEVERAHPHRIVAWSGPEGERAELLGSERLPYWQMNRRGDEKHLSRIGLTRD